MELEEALVRRSRRVTTNGTGVGKSQFVKFKRNDFSPVASAFSRSLKCAGDLAELFKGTWLKRLENF
ncbi:hypothetical protein RUM43_004390, partial [Polyplax serrata]